jgi:hypothetical protein
MKLELVFLIFQNKFHTMKINIHKKSNNLNLGKKIFFKQNFIFVIHSFFFKYYHDL